MKLHKITLILFLIISGCCKDEIVQSNKLNEFEKSLIPYISYQELTFIDNEGNTFIANSQPKEIIIDTDREGPESCRLTEYEEETNFLNFPSKDILLKLELRANYGTYFSLTVASESDNNNNNNNGRFDLACEGLFNLSIEERLTDLSINQFDFQNILVFQNCSESTEIEQIIYSTINGIEFIEFSDGKWLKLNE